jgi:hypothetical protein
MKPVINLAEALHEACEAAITDTGMTPDGLIEALGMTMSWAIAITAPEDQARIRAGLTAMIPKIFQLATEQHEAHRRPSN